MNLLGATSKFNLFFSRFVSLSFKIFFVKKKKHQILCVFFHFVKFCLSLVALERDLSALMIHIRGTIVEYPIDSIKYVAFGYDLSEFTHVPVQLPTDTLTCVVVMKNRNFENNFQSGVPRKLNLVFASTEERDDFIIGVLCLIEKAKKY